MALGYKIDVLDDLPVIVVKISFPPRFDVEHMFAEMARDVQTHLGDSLSRRMYRINDMSLYNNFNIATHVLRGMEHEIHGWPGTNSDPRVYSIMVGKGDNVRLVVEQIRTERYGRWNVPGFPTLEDALAQIRKWESGEEVRPPDRLEPAGDTRPSRTVL